MNADDDTAKDDKARRRGEALRANLRRRKVQARGMVPNDDASDDPDAAKPTGKDQAP